MKKTGNAIRWVHTVTIVSVYAALICGGCAKRPVTVAEPAAEPAPRPTSNEVIVDARLHAGNDDLEGAGEPAEHCASRLLGRSDPSEYRVSGWGFYGICPRQGKCL